VDGYIVTVEDASVAGKPPPRQPIAAYAKRIRIADLRPAHSYRFRVAAEGSGFRRSEWTSATFRTEQPRYAPDPPLPPALVRGGTEGCEDVRLWMPIERAGCGSASEWALQYRPLSINTWLDHEQHIVTREKRVGDGLPSNMTYVFRLIGRNAIGSSAPGEPTEPVFLCHLSGIPGAVGVGLPSPAGALDSSAAAEPLWAMPASIGLLAAAIAFAAYRCAGGHQRTRRGIGGAKYQRAQCSEELSEDGLDAFGGGEADGFASLDAASSYPGQPLEVRIVAPSTSPHPIRLEISLDDFLSTGELLDRLSSVHADVTGLRAPFEVLCVTAVGVDGVEEDVGQHTSLENLRSTGHLRISVSAEDGFNHVDAACGAGAGCVNAQRPVGQQGRTRFTL